jgi:hypothetical protein
MLKDLAHERIGSVLETHERKLAKDLERLRMKSFGLGAESITAVAGLELNREEVLMEKRFYEKFMDTLIPGSISKKQKMETEELLKAIAPPESESSEKKD